MATHRHEITEETAEHPLTRCRDCSGRHLDEFPLIKVSLRPKSPTRKPTRTWTLRPDPS